MVEQKKKSQLGQVLLLIGLLLIAVGVGINFYNEMFANNNETPPVEENSNESEQVQIPNDMDLVSESINTNLGDFLLYRYDALTLSGQDLLQTAANRLDLVNLILTKEEKTTLTESEQPFPYVSEEEYKTKYLELFGSEEQYTQDIAEAYSVKDIVDSTLGVGYIGWNAANYGAIATERVLTAATVEYIEEEQLFLITGTYEDSTLGSQIATGNFEIKYNNNKNLVSVVLTQNI